MENNAQDYVRNVLGISNNTDQIGAVPNGSKRNKNGLDDIDRWAMGIGRAENRKRAITPRKTKNFATV